MRIQLGERLIGDHEPALIVAELGINHGGNIDTALEMVRAAAEAGADAIKVQAFTAAGFCTEAATYKGERQVDLFRRHELPPAALSDIADECKRCGVIFFGTPDSVGQARILVALGAPCIKVGSDDLVHTSLLRELAGFRLPIILSTGMASLIEIQDALLWLQDVAVILLHCVSEYPTPDERVNLRRMVALSRYNALVGYSDHSWGIGAAVGAVWAGASVIEKHFTLDRSAPGPDNAFSTMPEDWRVMVERIREAEKMLGDGAFGPTDQEREMRTLARRSIVAGRAIVEGETITLEMLAFKRPGDGLAPWLADRIAGRRASRSLAQDEQLHMGDWQ